MSHRHPLLLWIQARGLSIDEFGRMIGCRSRTTVRRYIHGERIPGRRQMDEITRVTAGVIRYEDFRLAAAIRAARKRRRAERRQPDAPPAAEAPS